MIHDQIEKIQTTLEHSQDVPAETRESLLRLLASLKLELGATEKVTEPAPRETPSDDALERLRTSMEGLETSHPEMVGMVNRLATTLSNMGI